MPRRHVGEINSCSGKFNSCSVILLILRIFLGSSFWGAWGRCLGLNLPPCGYYASTLPLGYIPSPWIFLRQALSTKSSPPQTPECWDYRCEHHVPPNIYVKVRDLRHWKHLAFMSSKLDGARSSCHPYLSWEHVTIRARKIGTIRPAYRDNYHIFLSLYLATGQWHRSGC
jgi:hypothetical protein